MSSPLPAVKILLLFELSDEVSDLLISELTKSHGIHGGFDPSQVTGN